MVTRAILRAGREDFYDDANFETVTSNAAVAVSEDFIGGGHTAGFPAAGSPVAGYPWVKKIVGAAPPTAALISNAANGQAQFALAATSEAEEASIYFNDSLAIDLTKRALIEFRAALTVPPSIASAGAFMGACQAWASGGALASARYIGFGVNGNNTLVLYLKDGVSTLAVTAGYMSTPSTPITLDTNFHIFSIDMTNPADVVFAFDGNRCNAVSALPWAATPSNSLSQLYMGVYKTATASLGTLVVDKVDGFTNRV